MPETPKRQAPEFLLIGPRTIGLTDHARGHLRDDTGFYIEPAARIGWHMAKLDMSTSETDDDS